MMGTKLLPKGLAGFVPISIEVNEQKVESILLDDDDLVRMTWEMSFEKHNKSLRTFSNSADFLNKINTISKQTPIYIDSELGEDIHGEDIAISLHDDGFENLYMASGHDPEHFKHLWFLKGVVGKSAPVA